MGWSLPKTSKDRDQRASASGLVDTWRFGEVACLAYVETPRSCVLIHASPSASVPPGSSWVISFYNKPVKVKKVTVLVTQSCPTLCYSMDFSSPISSAHGILQARILDWVAIPFSKRSSQPRDWSQVSSIAGRFFTVWATRQAPVIHIHNFCRKYWIALPSGFTW